MVQDQSIREGESIIRESDVSLDVSAISGSSSPENKTLENKTSVRQSSFPFSLDRFRRSVSMRLFGVALTSFSGMGGSSLASAQNGVNQPQRTGSTAVAPDPTAQQIKTTPKMDRQMWIVSVTMAAQDDPHLGHLLSKFNTRYREYQKQTPIRRVGRLGDEMINEPQMRFHVGVSRDAWESKRVKYEMESGLDYPVAFNARDTIKAIMKGASNFAGPKIEAYAEAYDYFDEQLKVRREKVLSRSEDAGDSPLNTRIPDVATEAADFFDIVKSDPEARNLYERLLKHQLPADVDDTTEEIYRKLPISSQTGVRISGVEDRVDGVEGRVDGVESRMDNLEDWLSNLESKLSGMEREARENFLAQQRKLGALEGDLGELADQVAVLYHLQKEVQERQRAEDEQRAYEADWGAVHSGAQLFGNVLRVARVEDAGKIAAIADRSYDIVRAVSDFRRGLKQADDLSKLTKLTDVGNFFNIANAAMNLASLFFGGKSEVQLLQEWLQEQFSDLRGLIRDEMKRLNAKVDQIQEQLDRMDRKLDSIHLMISSQENQLHYIIDLLHDQGDTLLELLRLDQADKWANYENEFGVVSGACGDSRGRLADDPKECIHQIAEFVRRFGMDRSLNGQPDVRNLTDENYALKQEFFQASGNLLFMQRYYNECVRKPEFPEMELHRGLSPERLGAPQIRQIPAGSGVSYQYKAINEKQVDALPNPVVLKDAAKLIIQLLRENEAVRDDREAMEAAVEALCIIQDQFSYLYQLTQNISLDHLSRGLDLSVERLESLKGSENDNRAFPDSLRAFEREFARNFLDRRNNPGGSGTDMSRTRQRLVLDSTVTDFNMLERDCDGLPTITFHDNVIANTRPWVLVPNPKDPKSTPDFQGRFMLEGYELGRHFPKQLRDILILLDQEDPYCPPINFTYQISQTDKLFNDNSFEAELSGKGGYGEVDYRCRMYRLDFEVQMPDPRLEHGMTPVWRGYVEFPIKVGQKRHIHWGDSRAATPIYVSPDWEPIETHCIVPTDASVETVFVDEIWRSAEYFRKYQPSSEVIGTRKDGGHSWDSLSNRALAEAAGDPWLEQFKLANGVYNSFPYHSDIELPSSQHDPSKVPFSSFSYMRLGGRHLQKHEVHLNIQEQLSSGTKPITPSLSPEEQQKADELLAFHHRRAKLSVLRECRDELAKKLERKSDGTIPDGIYQSYQRARSGISYLRNLFSQTFQAEMADPEHPVHQLFHGTFGRPYQYKYNNAGLSVEELGAGLPDSMNAYAPDDSGMRVSLKRDDDREELVVKSGQRAGYEYRPFTSIVEFHRQNGNPRIQEIWNNAKASGEGPEVYLTNGEILEYFEDRFVRTKKDLTLESDLSEREQKLALQLIEADMAALRDLFEVVREWNQVVLELRAAHTGELTPKLVVLAQHASILHFELDELEDFFLDDRNRIGIKEGSEEEIKEKEKALRFYNHHGGQNSWSRSVGTLVDGILDTRGVTLKVPPRIGVLSERDLATLVAEADYCELIRGIGGHRVACRLLKGEIERKYGGGKIGNEEYRHWIDILEGEIQGYGKLASELGQER